MFLIKSPQRAVFDPILVRDPVLLRAARLCDHAQWAALREKSRSHLVRWEEDWSPHEMTPAFFRKRVKTFHRAMRRGVSLPLLIFRRDDEALVGGATLSSLRYGASRSAQLGYWIGAPHIRRGYGAAAVRAMLDHAFDALELNRVQAACQPANAASKALLLKLGFQEEGLARSYLRINGSWRDHLIFAFTAEDHRVRAGR